MRTGWHSQAGSFTRRSPHPLGKVQLERETYKGIVLAPLSTAKILRPVLLGPCGQHGDGSGTLQRPYIGNADAFQEESALPTLLKPSANLWEGGWLPQPNCELAF